MKNYFVSTSLKNCVLALILVAGINTMNAQFSIGGGLGYNNEINAPGLVVKAEVEIMEGITISPSVSYFSGSEAKLLGSAFKNNLFAVDVNAQYAIEIMMDELNVYPLAGLNYSSYNNGAEGIVFEEERIRQNDGNALGLNIGAGGRWYFSDQLSAFVELKYVVSNFNQVVLGGGILFEL